MTKKRSQQSLFYFLPKYYLTKGRKGCAFCIKVGHYFQIKKPSPRRFFYLVCIIFLVRPGLGRTFCFAKLKNDAHSASQYAFLIVITW